MVIFCCKSWLYFERPLEEFERPFWSLKTPLKKTLSVPTDADIHYKSLIRFNSQNLFLMPITHNEINHYKFLWLVKKFWCTQHTSKIHKTLCKCYSSYFMWSLQLFHYQWSFSRYTKISVCNPGTQKWSKRNLQQLQTHLLVVPICKNIWEISYFTIN